MALADEQVGWNEKQRTRGEMEKERQLGLKRPQSGIEAAQRLVK